MSEAKHTAWEPEPIAVARSTDVTGYPMYAVLGVARGDLRREQETRARLESCYNACAGINPAAIPQMIEALGNTLAFLDALGTAYPNVRNSLGARALHDRARAALADAGVTDAGAQP